VFGRVGDLYVLLYKDKWRDNTIFDISLNIVIVIICGYFVNAKEKGENVYQLMNVFVSVCCSILFH